MLLVYLALMSVLFYVVATVVIATSYTAWHTGGGNYVYDFALDTIVEGLAHASGWPRSAVQTPFMIVGLWIIAMPLAFTVIPISRRRAKLRWQHILRAWVYSVPVSLALGIVFIVLEMVMFHLDAVLRTQFRGLMGLFTVMWACISIGWILHWWPVTISRYFKMSQPMAVAIAMHAIAGLAAVTATALFLLWRGQLYRYFI